MVRRIDGEASRGGPDRAALRGRVMHENTGTSSFEDHDSLCYRDNASVSRSVPVTPCYLRETLFARKGGKGVDVKSFVRPFSRDFDFDVAHSKLRIIKENDL